MCCLFDENGYPGSKPPWGNLTAIDLNSGKIKWQVPFGEYENLTELGISLTGTENYGGATGTAGNLIFAVKKVVIVMLYILGLTTYHEEILDTTDAWRLRNHRERLIINFAGILTELHLALIATFLWAILPDGGFKSVAFFIATTSWISSLAINVSPFMRFDGYYVFADWLKAENLQPRSFALARWQLREIQ